MTDAPVPEYDLATAMAVPPGTIGIMAPPLIREALTSAFRHRLPAIDRWTMGDPQVDVLIAWAPLLNSRWSWDMLVESAACRSLILLGASNEMPPWNTGEQRIRIHSLATSVDDLATSVLDLMRDWSDTTLDRTFLVPTLTNRECDVISQMADGLTNPQIAEELGIGLESVKTHVSKILRKTGASSRREAIQLCRQHGLLAFRSA